MVQNKQWKKLLANHKGPNIQKCFMFFEGKHIHIGNYIFLSDTEPSTTLCFRQ